MSSLQGNQNLSSVMCSLSKNVRISLAPRSSLSTKKRICSRSGGTLSKKWMLTSSLDITLLISISPISWIVLKH